MNNRTSTPILDAVKRERGELYPYGKPAPVDPWAGAPSPEQKQEAARLLAGSPLETLTHE